MRNIRQRLPLLSLTLLAGSALGRGVTPYLPLNLDPQAERDIERVLVMGGKPTLRRPLAAAWVVEALPRACQVDVVLCERVRGYLSRYMRDTGLEFASIGAQATHGARTVLPNQHGETARSPFQVSGAGYVQPSDYLLLNLGAVAYEGRQTPTGSQLSLGFDWAQVDLGYRDHWWSPMTDSAYLISTAAPTMPSLTLSNYRPLSRAGFDYELFLARMSYSNKIEVSPTGALTSGYPKFAGVHFGIEPQGSGWSLGLNRVLIFGGGAAGGQSISDLFRAFFNPARAQTTGFGGRHVIGKQEASVSSQFIYPGPLPFTVYFEYGGNDTTRGHNYILGRPALSAGVRVPKVGPFDVTYEFSEWENSWYVHSYSAVQTGYGDGITNDRLSIGHWFGDQRLFGDAVGGQSNLLRLGWEPRFGGRFETELRTLANDSYYSAVAYKREFLGSLSYAHPWRDATLGAQLDYGRDVFGDRFTRLGAFLRYGDTLHGAGAVPDESAGGTLSETGRELYVAAGANGNRVLVDVTRVQPRYTTSTEIAPHAALGARRRVSDHQDLGVALEADQIQGRTLLSVHALDYRYRFDGPLAVVGFIGAARYALATPAFGEYLGAGMQWRDIVPRWDLGLDVSYAVKVARERVRPTDPQGGARSEAFYDIYAARFYVARKF